MKENKVQSIVMVLVVAAIAVLVFLSKTSQEEPYQYQFNGKGLEHEAMISYLNDSPDSIAITTSTFDEEHGQYIDGLSNYYQITDGLITQNIVAPSNDIRSERLPESIGGGIHLSNYHVVQYNGEWYAVSEDTEIAGPASEFYGESWDKQLAVNEFLDALVNYSEETGRPISLDNPDDLEALQGAGFIVTDTKQ